MMARKNRTVAERQKALQSVAPEANFTLAGVRRMSAGAGMKKFCCTISGHCRTQIFEFPRLDFCPNGDEPHQFIWVWLFWNRENRPFSQ